MGRILTRFLLDQRGATAIEYGLLAMLIAVAVIGAVTLAGNGIANLFGNSEQGVSGAIENALDSAGG